MATRPAPHCGASLAVPLSQHAPNWPVRWGRRPDGVGGARRVTWRSAEDKSKPAWLARGSRVEDPGSQDAKAEDALVRGSIPIYERREAR